MGGTALSSVLGGFLGSKSAKKSARAQQAAIQQAMALQREGMGKAEGLLQPGANYKPAMMRLQDLLGLNGGQSQQDAYGAFRDTPGYRFNLEQGLGAANRSAAAHGAAMSGRTLTDLAKFGSGLADQTYNQYYNNLDNMYRSQLGTAGNLAGVYTGGADSLAKLAVGGGQAKADGIMGSANAWTNSLQNLANVAGYGAGKMNPSASSYGTASPVWNGMPMNSIYG
jgi:hypothetical protein